MTKRNNDLNSRLTVLETITRGIDKKIDSLCQANGKQDEMLIDHTKLIAGISATARAQWWLIGVFGAVIIGAAAKMLFGGH